MTKPFSSKLHFTLLLLINITLLSACHSGDLSKENRLSTSVNLSDAPLEINILETGKSDCIVIKVEDKTVMIDTGLDQNGEKIADFLEKEQIDVICTTWIEIETLILSEVSQKDRYHMISLISGI